MDGEFVVPEFIVIKIVTIPIIICLFVRRRYITLGIVIIWCLVVSGQGLISFTTREVLVVGGNLGSNGGVFGGDVGRFVTAA